jgi:hypothetical protein
MCNNCLLHKSKGQKKGLDSKSQWLISEEHWVTLQRKNNCDWSILYINYLSHFFLNSPQPSINSLPKEKNSKNILYKVYKQKLFKVKYMSVSSEYHIMILL